MEDTSEESGDVARVPQAYRCHQCREDREAELHWEDRYVVRCLSCAAHFDPCMDPVRWGSGIKDFGKTDDDINRFGKEEEAV